VLPEAQNQCRLIEEELADQLRLKTNLRYDLEINVSDLVTLELED
jgi:hypothetical protein